MTRLPSLSEDHEQMVFITYLEQRGLRFTAIPNNTYSPHISVKVRNKRMGLRAGFPDMVVVVPGVGLACVEMKRAKSPPSATSPEQLEWIDALNTCPGVEARVCKGADAAIAFIEELSPSKIGAALLDSSIF
jgi:hypothetical protein